MNINELLIVIKHVRRNSSCPHCNKRYNIKDISVLASGKNECLLELRCPYCKKTAMTDIVASPPGSTEIQLDSVPLINRVFRNGISDNDILDVKNFLNEFDGDFKKLFYK